MSEVKTNKISSVSTNGDITLDPDGTGDVVVSSGHKLGVGTTSPQSDLSVKVSASRQLDVIKDSGDDHLVLKSSAPDASYNLRSIELAGEKVTFSTGASSATSYTERMRIDSSGNVLVGKTSTDISVAGSRIGSFGAIFTRSDGSEPLRVNRTSTDGELIRIDKDGSQTGRIGTSGGNVFIAGSDAGIKFGNNSAFVPTNNAGSNTDNSKDVGSASVRFDDVFATNGSIQTSDQNEKQNIASLTTAETTAAKAISKLFKTFKWQDKVAAKGEAARTHAGVIAQEVQTAMTDAGLDAADYAFWCSNTWWEADGETYDTADEAPEGATQRTRLGIRYPELLAFIGAATEQRLADLETRVTALEDA